MEGAVHRTESYHIGELPSFDSVIRWIELGKRLFSRREINKEGRVVGNGCGGAPCDTMLVRLVVDL